MLCALDSSNCPPVFANINYPFGPRQCLKKRKTGGEKYSICRYKYKKIVIWAHTNNTTKERNIDNKTERHTTPNRHIKLNVSTSRDRPASLHLTQRQSSPATHAKAAFITWDISGTEGISPATSEVPVFVPHKEASIKPFSSVTVHLFRSI